MKNIEYKPTRLSNRFNRRTMGKDKQLYRAVVSGLWGKIIDSLMKNDCKCVAQKVERGCHNDGFVERTFRWMSYSRRLSKDYEISFLFQENMLFIRGSDEMGGQYILQQLYAKAKQK